MITRLKNTPIDRLVLIVILLTLVALPLWVLIVYVLWYALTTLGYSGDFWGALEGLSSAAALTLTFAGGIIIIIQLNDATETRDLQIYNDVFERMMSDRDIEARRWIYIHLPENVPQGLELMANDPEGQAHVKQVLNSFDHLGFLIQHDFGVSDRVIQWVSPFVVKTWIKVGPYVDHEAERRNEPDYYESARLLYERCRDWREEHGKSTGFTKVEKAM